jgi:16S rRNA processing protein RimM
MAAKQNSTGAPDGAPVYLVIGFLRRPHGVRGEIIMDIHTDFPERIKPERKIWVGDRHQVATFDTIRPHGNGLLVSFRGVDTVEDAGKFRNQWVYVKASEVPPLPDGQYYKYQLVGVDVADENGNPLGKLVEVLETGANDVYVVRDKAGKEILLPAIPSVVLEVSIERNAMKVHLLDGL